ncbi:hypothetical protein ANN_02130 [Periplaneta americana]|uniref:DUF4817 domain-containing protein n=1 Tax=Periplaneta americana TaxID=6978 RepID=A0ABQ8TVE6_PERAM|nr:hypothetical protein ANN_02130 [Periplaneta americana]
MNRKKTDENMKKTDENMKKTDENMKKTDENMNKTDENMKKTDENMKKTDENMKKTDENMKKTEAYYLCAREVAWQVLRSFRRVLTDTYRNAGSGRNVNCLETRTALFSTFCVNVKMQYTLNQRLFLVKQYWITNSITANERVYQREFGVRNPPKRNTILGLVNKLETTGSLTLDDLKHNITQEIQAIDNRVLQRVASNMERRVELCLMQDGGHFQHLL